jgi:DNA polymerase-3 subunit beta
LLSDYVALLDKSKQVSLSVGSKGGKLHLLCERYEANIATLPADDFPAVPATDREPCLEVDGAILKAAIDQVVFAVAPDDTRPVLAGVLIRLEAGNLTLAAADGFRLAVRSCRNAPYRGITRVDRAGAHAARSQSMPVTGARAARGVAGLRD